MLGWTTVCRGGAAQDARRDAGAANGNVRRNTGLHDEWIKRLLTNGLVDSDVVMVLCVHDRPVHRAARERTLVLRVGRMRASERHQV